VEAPAGTLGLVLDTGNEGLVVYIIKETSPLFRQVQVGDRLVSVDGQVVSRMSTTKVSRLAYCYEKERSENSLIRKASSRLQIAS
jgi:C-terminal processing protease CtpA/Prc